MTARDRLLGPHRVGQALKAAAIRKPAALLQRVLHDKRGLSAVTVAVSLPVLFGVAGLGIDTGLWYTIKRQNQSAADAAALSAAYEVIGGHNCPTDVTTYLVPAASEAATRNNYGGTTPSVTCPYSDSVVASGVKVTVPAGFLHPRARGGIFWRGERPRFDKFSRAISPN